MDMVSLRKSTSPATDQFHEAILEILPFVMLAGCDDCCSVWLVQEDPGVGIPSEADRDHVQNLEYTLRYIAWQLSQPCLAKVLPSNPRGCQNQKVHASELYNGKHSKQLKEKQVKSFVLRRTLLRAGQKTPAQAGIWDCDWSWMLGLYGVALQGKAHGFANGSRKGRQG